MSQELARAIYAAVHEAMAAEPRTREPMNALAVWTEIGRALAGTLERVGAERGMLCAAIGDWCRAQGAAPADLGRWAYRLEPGERLSRQDLARVLARVPEAVERALPQMAAAAEASGEERRRLFLAVVRGWFPVGLDIVRALPAAGRASEAERLGALAAWCARFLPQDAAGPAELGVRVER